MRVKDREDARDVRGWNERQRDNAMIDEVDRWQAVTPTPDVRRPPNYEDPHKAETRRIGEKNLVSFRQAMN